MSRVGKKAIDVPSGVTVTVAGSDVVVKGPRGELSLALPDKTTAQVADGGKVCVERVDETREARSRHGLVRSLIANMVEGVATGFKRELEIEGVGFKAVVEGTRLVLTLGFASPIAYDLPDGVKVNVEGGTALVVSGADKQKVGLTAARIRSFFPAEPYKGKGIKYKDEHVRRKVGKTVA